MQKGEFFARIFISSSSLCTPCACDDTQRTLDTDTVIFHFVSYTNNSARRHKKEGMIKNKMYVQRYRIDIRQDGRITEGSKVKEKQNAINQSKAVLFESTISL